MSFELIERGKLSRFSLFECLKFAKEAKTEFVDVKEVKHAKR